MNRTPLQWWDRLTTHVLQQLLGFAHGISAERAPVSADAIEAPIVVHRNVHNERQSIVHDVNARSLFVTFTSAEFAVTFVRRQTRRIWS